MWLRRSLARPRARPAKAIESRVASCARPARVRASMRFSRQRILLTRPPAAGPRLGPRLLSLPRAQKRKRRATCRASQASRRASCQPPACSSSSPRRLCVGPGQVFMRDLLPRPRLWITFRPVSTFHSGFSITPPSSPCTRTRSNGPNRDESRPCRSRRLGRRPTASGGMAHSSGPTRWPKQAGSSARAEGGTGCDKGKPRA